MFDVSTPFEPLPNRVVLACQTIDEGVLGAIVADHLIVICPDREACVDLAGVDVFKHIDLVRAMVGPREGRAKLRSFSQKWLNATSELRGFAIEQMPDLEELGIVMAPIVDVRDVLEGVLDDPRQRLTIILDMVGDLSTCLEAVGNALGAGYNVQSIVLRVVASPLHARGLGLGEVVTWAAARGLVATEMDVDSDQRGEWIKLVDQDCESAVSVSLNGETDTHSTGQMTLRMLTTEGLHKQIETQRKSRTERDAARSEMEPLGERELLARPAAAQDALGTLSEALEDSRQQMAGMLARYEALSKDADVVRERLAVREADLKKLSEECVALKERLREQDAAIADFSAALGASEEANQEQVGMTAKVQCDLAFVQQRFSYVQRRCERLEALLAEVLAHVAPAPEKATAQTRDRRAPKGKRVRDGGAA